MTVISSQLSCTDRQRLLERLDELRDLDTLMRKPGTLAGPREGKDDTTEGTTS